MIAVGVLAVLCWRRKTGVALKFFMQGGLWWGVAMAPKFAMDLTVTPGLSSWLFSNHGFTVTLVVMGLYVGLRTGLFESGAALLAFNREGLRDSSVDEATAFGIGFGAVEAIFLALPSLIQIAAFNLNPTLVEELPLEQLMQVLTQLNAPTWVVGAPIIERAFTMAAHLYAALLVYSYVRREDNRLLIQAVVYKSVLDAMVPFLQVILSSGGFGMVYVVEVWVVILGSVGLWGSMRLREGFSEAPPGT